MNSTYNPGRVAGLIYLFLVVTGPLRLMYIPTKLFVPGNATATASNIAAHEMLFRLGMVSEVVSGVICIFLALALYGLLKGVNQNLAVLMVALGGVLPAALDFFNELNDAAALLLVHGANFLGVFDKPQRDALAMLFLHLYDQENFAAEIFWGLWLIPLAILVYRSRFLPRFLGVWLFVNGVAYVILSFTGLLFPQYYNVAFNGAFLFLFGEVAFMLWLVIKGGRPKSFGDTVPARSVA